MNIIRSDPRVLRAHFACTSDKVQGNAGNKYVEGKIEYDDQYDLQHVPPNAVQRYIRDGMSVHYYSIESEQNSTQWFGFAQTLMTRWINQ